MDEDIKSTRPVLVLGAGRPLGQAVVEALRAGGHAVIATLRTSQAETERSLRAAGADIRVLDFDEPRGIADLAAEAGAIISLVRIPLASKVLLSAGLPPHKRCVFFSSHNAAVDFTTPVYDGFRAAEAAVGASSLAWTILRPTMIYGFAGDGNISRLVSSFRKLPFAVLPSQGTARMQPVYYRDLARVAASVLDVPATIGQILEIGGPDTLRVIDVYSAAANGKPVIPVPLGPVRWAAKVAAALGLPFPLSTAQLARAEIDKIARIPACLPEAYRPKTPFSVVIAALLRGEGAPGAPQAARPGGDESPLRG